MEFRVLGPVEAWDGDRLLDVGGPKPRAVLAVLLAEANREVRPDQLIDAVWPDGPPRTAVGTLQTLVYRLRRRLAEQTPSSDVDLPRGPVGYALRVAPEQLDATRFEQLVGEGRDALDTGDHERAVALLREGLELWHGDAFSGVEIAVVRERARTLSELRLAAAEWCMTAELALGRGADVVAELESLVAENPYRERLWTLLMTALYQCGRRADALGAYQRLYKLLDEDLGIDPSQPVRDLHQRILEGDPALEAAGADRAPAAGRTKVVVPRQLPVAVNYFSGRKEHLERLDALIPAEGTVASRAGVISVIAGAAGVGKTTLAIHWAHRVADRFPDGQLYVNLRGFDPSGRPARPAEVLRGFLEALDVPPDRIPSEVEAAAALYRSLLDGKRMLVVLDNAVDEEQVRSLLPASPGCLVLVTSRNQLTGLVTAEAARPVLLGNLAGAESHDLLARRIGFDRLAGEPQATSSILDRCGGLPLALAIVAARAGTHPTFPLRALADELDASRTSLDAFVGADLTTDLRTVLSWSCRQLDDETKRMFWLLALHPGPDITAPAAASLAARPPGVARAGLAELCRLNLLTEHQPGRYTYHDLLRAYATELAHDLGGETDRRAAECRCLDHYMHTALRAVTLITPHREPIEPAPPASGVLPEPLADYDQAATWLSAERDVLLALLHRFEGAGLDVQLWQLAWTLDDFLARQGLWKERESALCLALDLTRSLGDIDAQARIHRLSAMLCNDLGRADEAIAHLRQALRIDVELGNQAGEAANTYGLAFAFYLRGDYAASLDHALRAASLYRSVGRERGLAQALGGAAWCCAELGRLEEARGHAEEALAAVEKTDDGYGLAPAWRVLGYIHTRLGDHAEAIKAYRESLDLFRWYADSRGEAGALNDLGDVHHAAGQQAAAVDYWRRSLDILETIDHPDADSVRAKLEAAG